MTRIAIAHDYLTQRGGAERVVLSMLRAFPNATIYTTLYNAGSTYPEFRDARIVTSPLNRVGLFRRNHRAALPLLAFAARAMRISEDVVVVSSSGWAHGFNARGKRLVYCYSPARWLYQTEAYLGSSPRISMKQQALRAMRPFLTRWDQAQAAKAARYLAISNVVQQRILETYGRTSEVLPAPHTADPNAPQTAVPALRDWANSGYHLVVSRLLPYKNVDAAVAAFRTLPEERLVVVGLGPELDRLLGLAGDNVRMLQNLNDSEIRWVYGHAQTLIAPSIEDYGLTPLEAGAYGVPTLALRGGGYLDTIAEGVTGSFFDHPTPCDIRMAVLDNKSRSWDSDRIVSHVENFSEAPFISKLREFVSEL